jgi:type II secretory pathway pseudopilin PulG
MIEIMAVIVILLILMAFLLPRLAGMRETVEENTTKVFLGGQLRAAIGEIDNDTGDFPPSAWKGDWGAAPNSINLGSECLYLSFWAEGRSGLGLSDERLENLDGDSTKKSLTTLGAKDLFEVCDDWGNPIAYFHFRDYGRKDVYMTYDLETGELVESTVQAVENPKTKSYYEPHGYQLISAGRDGYFGTEDDLYNFKR